MKFCWWVHGQKLWCHNLYFKIALSQRRPRVANLAEIMKILTIFIKRIVRDSKKSQKNQKLCVKMEYISVFVDIAKFANFQWKINFKVCVICDFSRIQGACHVIYIFFESSLGKA